MRKVLVVGPGPGTKGGIAKVIEYHKKSSLWVKWNCTWVPSYNDKGSLMKIYFFIKGLIRFIFLLPNSKLVHIHLSEPVSAIRKTFFFSLSRLFRKKTILHFHSYSVETTIKGKWKKLYKWLFSHADSVIVLSNWWKSEVLKVFDTKDLQVVVNPCEKISEPNFEKRKKNILFAGSLNSRKGFVDLIKAFASLENKDDYKLVFAGNGDIQGGIEISSQLNIENDVQFLGWIESEMKHKVFSESSIFCLPSYAEGFPMSVIDAASYGLPIISTPVGGLADIFEDRKSILFFNPGNIYELKECLNSLIENEFLRKSLGKESFVLAQSTFANEKVADHLDSIYTSIFS